MGIAGSSQDGRIFAGLAERSETHHRAVRTARSLMGFAALNPSYGPPMQKRRGPDSFHFYGPPRIGARVQLAQWRWL
jgi:hypothetical protein